MKKKLYFCFIILVFIQSVNAQLTDKSHIYCLKYNSAVLFKTAIHVLGEDSIKKYVNAKHVEYIFFIQVDSVGRYLKMYKVGECPCNKGPFFTLDNIKVLDQYLYEHNIKFHFKDTYCLESGNYEVLICLSEAIKSYKKQMAKSSKYALLERLISDTF